MASSSSSSQSWNHDVFLSFRGEDTRKTFVDHLYAALVQQGIHTYKDDENLPQGESIGPALFKAIQESRIAVIIFSENYADSSWCLDELAYIMKCRDGRGQIVMPIFYHVDPSEVRQLKRKYGESFAKHDTKNKNKVESWRNALVNAANLSGWVPKKIANGHESKGIKEIVDTISNRLFALISDVDKDLIGIGTRLKVLKSYLETGSGGVRMVGIWGVGGGGKTTLASSVYMEISHQFEGRCFVENIREESSKFGLQKLQEKVLSAILKTKVEVESVLEGRYMIKSRFCRKNVLILLDDVDDVDQLEALAGSHDWFGAGSRLIITTRDEHLLTKKADVIYGVSLLSRDEAIQLFRRHAYREHKPVDDYEKLSLAVVAYAGGLPLALKILGSFLHDKDNNEWMSALAKLKEIPNARIMDKLKISYDGLQPDEKELFLDIACFFRGRNKDEAMHMLEACGFHPVIGIKVLIQKTLITVLDGKFDMHDLVQEMGHYIVRGNHPNNPEKHSRVWKEQDVINICTMTTMTENDKIEAFVHDRHMFGFSVDLAKVVANMKNLRLLSCHSTECFPTNFQLKKLCYLKVQYFHGFERQLWEDLTHLPTLKVIDLSSSSFRMTPSFSGLPNLERLTLCNCYRLKDIDPSIGHLERLVYLNLKGCSSLKMIPPFIRAKKLETLILSRCDKLGEFPKIQQNMNSLKYLHLNETEIEVLPSYVGKYCTSLIYLNLSYCFALKSIEFDLYLLEHLEVLDFSGDTELCELPVDPINVECSLEEISQPYKSIKHMRLQFFQRGLVGLEFHHLPRLLRKLNLRNCCLGDGDIDFEFWELSNLEELDLGGNQFSCLQFSLLRLNRLKLLNVSFCKCLVELSELPSSIAVLRADSCSSLERVGDISKCKWLWKVSLKGCNKQGLVGGDIVLTSLLQGNAVEHHFLSLALPGHNIRKGFVPWLVNKKTFTLPLPSNWYDDFVGFLVCTVTNSYHDPRIMIIVKHQMGDDSQTEFWQESTKAETDCSATTFVCYVSFSSLRHTAWWNSSHNMLSFSVGGVDKFGVVLIPRKSKRDSAHTRDMVTNCSEFWDEEIKDKNTFTIKHDSESSIEILWHPYSACAYFDEYITTSM